MVDCSPVNIIYLYPQLEEYLFFTEDGSLPHAQGNVGKLSTHVTLISGLLESGQTWSNHVLELLKTELSSGLPDVSFSKLSWFPVASKTEEAVALVAEVEGEAAKWFHVANQKLKTLPHVELFPFKPHVTLGYFQPEAVKILADGETLPEPVILTSLGLNFGL